MRLPQRAPKTVAEHLATDHLLSVDDAGKEHMFALHNAICSLDEETRTTSLARCFGFIERGVSLTRPSYLEPSATKNHDAFHAQHHPFAYFCTLLWHQDSISEIHRLFDAYARAWDFRLENRFSYKTLGLTVIKAETMLQASIIHRSPHTMRALLIRGASLEVVPNEWQTTMGIGRRDVLDWVQAKEGAHSEIYQVLAAEVMNRQIASLQLPAVDSSTRLHTSRRHTI